MKFKMPKQKKKTEEGLQIFVSRLIESLEHTLSTLEKHGDSVSNIGLKYKDCFDWENMGIIEYLDFLDVTNLRLYIFPQVELDDLKLIFTLWLNKDSMDTLVKMELLPFTHPELCN